MHPKWYKNGLGYKNRHLKKIKQNVQNWYLCAVFTNTCQFSHLSILREPTGDILYIVSTFRRVRWVCGSITQNAQNVFVFGVSLFNDGFRVAVFIRVYFALHVEAFVFVLRFLFCIFLECPFLNHWTICSSWAKRNHTNYHEVLKDKSMRHREVYSKFYLCGERQPIRFVSFVFEKQIRKIMAEFYKVTAVKPFIDCLISCHLQWFEICKC